MSAKVCAVVVTYNRQELLQECIEALLNQSRPPELIWVFNNRSSDKTIEMIAMNFPPEKFPQVRVTTLPQNIGGAGGFHVGTREAFAAGFEWVWLMDDDTIPEREALDELLTSWASFPPERKPVLLASKAIWTDGSIHPMNVPQTRLGDAEAAYLAADRRAVLIRTATFVSVLIQGRCVETHGLPVADYFIWGEDVEYTGRILRDQLGVLVPRSVVVHKTTKKYGPGQGSSRRFYYFVRNGVWMITRSTAWTRNERIKLAIGFFRTIPAFFFGTRERWAGARAIAAGFWDSVFTRPHR